MKRAGLATGSKQDRGFTLIEVLLSVAILVLGISYIYPAFFKSADVLSRLSRQYEASSVIRDLIDESQAVLQDKRSVASVPSHGRKVRQDRVYEYEISFAPLDQKSYAWRMEIRLDWQGARPGHLSRSACLLR